MSARVFIKATFCIFATSIIPPFLQSAFAQTLAPLNTISDVLRDYDCSRSSDGQRSVNQIIQGQFYNWNESYSVVDGQMRIECIRQLEPQPLTLDKEQAADFISRSRGTGAVHQTEGPQRERSQDTIERSIIEDMIERARPMPVLTPEENKSEGKQKTQENLAFNYIDSMAATVSLSSPGDGVPNNEYVTADWSALTKFRGTQGNASQADVHIEPKSAPKLSVRQGERPLAVGVDDRTRINNFIFPVTSVGKLYQQYSDGSVYTCTATLVSGYAALTAGHCLHSRDLNGYATRVVFVPQQSQNTFGGVVTRPFSYKFASNIAVSQRWTQISGGSKINVLDSRYDYGVVYFDSPWTFTNTFAPVAYGHTGSSALNAGYPGVVQDTEGNEGAWSDVGSEQTRSLIILRSYQVREFNNDVSGGNSGGPFIGTDGVNYFLTGIVSYGEDELSGGAWLGGGNENTIRTAVLWTPSNSTPAKISSDLRAPLILSSNLSDDGASYLRFFNASPESGRVTVTFYDDYGDVVGTWLSPIIPRFASHQYSMSDIEDAANINTTGLTIYSAKINSEFSGLFQHVAWNVAGQGLTNLSGCSNGLSDNVTAAINVHSSQLDDSYPSYLVLHSVSAQTTTISADVYNPSTGARIGGITFPNVPAFASGILTATDLEDQLGHTPGPNEYHYNVVLTGDTAAYIQHQVDNTSAGMLTNMTGTCRLQ